MCILVLGKTCTAHNSTFRRSLQTNSIAKLELQKNSIVKLQNKYHSLPRLDKIPRVIWATLILFPFYVARFAYDNICFFVCIIQFLMCWTSLSELLMLFMAFSSIVLMYNRDIDSKFEEVLGGAEGAERDCIFQWYWHAICLPIRFYFRFGFF